MKKVITTMLLLALLASFFAFAGVCSNAAKESSTRTYNVPLRTNPPVIDGVGDDAAWEGAYTVEMSIAALKNGGYIKNIGNPEGATGSVKMIWSNASGREGLYFLCSVNDPTQGWAVDTLADGPHYEQLGDGLQVFIDPLYQRKATAKNCAMRFNFVPYRSLSGNGMCPTEEEAWWESWVWSGNQSSSGVLLKSTLDERDDDGKGSIDRVKLVSAYTMEIFIPWKALQLNYSDPPAGNLYDKLGIGLALHDTDWSYDIWYEACYGTGTYTFNPAPSILEVNYIADFSKKGKEAIQFPRFYNTLVLADANGTAPTEGSTGDGGSGNSETPTTEPDTQKTEAFDALTTAIDSAKTGYLENEEARDKYTEDSLQALSDAVTKAEGMTDANTVEEINAAKTSIDDAIASLVQKDMDENSAGTNEGNVGQTGTAIEEKSGMPIGAIIGIVIGAVVLAAAVVIIIVVMKKKKAAAPDSSSVSEEDTHQDGIE